MKVLQHKNAGILSDLKNNNLIKNTNIHLIPEND